MATQADRNIRRRERAFAVLDFYKHRLLQESGPVHPGEDGTDLFADLCHFLGQQGADPADTFRVALGHYQHETDPANADEEDTGHE